MNEFCERKVTYGVVNAEGQRVPYPFRYEKRPLLDTSRLSACLQKPVELSLAMVTARAEILNTLQSKMEGIYTWQPKRPGHLALKIALGTLGLVAVATVFTYSIKTR